nr:Uncharacterised protein [Streptococcus thermophilus]
MSKDSIPSFDQAQDADDAAKAAVNPTPTRNDSINNLGDPDADGSFQDRTEKESEKAN